MTSLLARLTVCVLVSLWFIAVADGLSNGHLHLWASLGLAVGGLRHSEIWSTLAKSGGSPCSRSSGGRICITRSYVRLDNSRRFLCQDGSTAASEYRFSRFSKLQGAVRPPG